MSQGLPVTNHNHDNSIFFYPYNFSVVYNSTTFVKYEIYFVLFSANEIDVGLRAKIDGKYDGYQYRMLTLSLAAAYNDDPHIEEKIIEVPVCLITIFNLCNWYTVYPHSQFSIVNAQEMKAVSLHHVIFGVRSCNDIPETAALLGKYLNSFVIDLEEIES